jgi:hypothetical protein
MNERDTFGRWLKQRRKGLDLTQHVLAVQSGCTVETIMHRPFSRGGVP